MEELRAAVCRRAGVSSVQIAAREFPRRNFASRDEIAKGKTPREFDARRLMGRRKSIPRSVLILVLAGFLLAGRRLRTRRRTARLAILRCWRRAGICRLAVCRLLFNARRAVHLRLLRRRCHAYFGRGTGNGRRLLLRIGRIEGSIATVIVVRGGILRRRSRLRATGAPVCCGAV